MNAIVQDTHSISEDQFNDTTWLRYFDIGKALEGLHSHIGTKASDKTKERYTRRNYERGIKYFMEWAGFPNMQLPTEQQLNQFISHLLHEKKWYTGGTCGTERHGISAKTVANSYLAPLRIFLRKLAKQQIYAYGTERDFINDCKDHISAAANVKNPPESSKTNIAPLWNPKFTRLNINQVNLVLDQFDRATITGARDYALLRLMFESALRVAEVQRITLNKITVDDDHYLVTVRGKRNNIDPVAISTELYRAIRDYVDIYNDPLEPDDPIYITNDTPVFQPIRKGNTHNRRDNANGMSASSIRNLVKRKTRAVLGDEYTCSAHDCRRTFAYIAFTQGMPLTEISKALRHADSSITWAYIGNQPDHGKTLLTNYVKIA